MVSGIARSVSPPSTDSSHLPAPSARPIYWILFKLLLFNSEWFGSKVTTSWNTSNRYNVERHMQEEQETDLCERQPSLRKLKSDSVLFCGPGCCCAHSCRKLAVGFQNGQLSLGLVGKEFHSITWVAEVVGECTLREIWWMSNEYLCNRDEW